MKKLLIVCLVGIFLNLSAMVVVYDSFPYQGGEVYPDILSIAIEK